jgi:hypothetical protein
MITKILLVGTGAILIMTSPIWAQSQSGVMTSSQNASSAMTTGAFQNLSPGDQKIANALFAAQPRTTTGPARLSRDQIAALKGSEGWGQVFSQMKTEGLLQAKNLGQVVSRSEHQIHATTTGAMSQSGRTVGVTNGLGRTTTFTSAHSASVGGTGGGHSVASAHANTGGPVTHAGGSVTQPGGSVTHAGGSLHGVGVVAHGR